MQRYGPANGQARFLCHGQLSIFGNIRNRTLKNIEKSKKEWFAQRVALDKTAKTYYSFRSVLKRQKPALSSYIY